MTLIQGVEFTYQRLYPPEFVDEFSVLDNLTIVRYHSVAESVILIVRMDCSKGALPGHKEHCQDMSCRQVEK